MLTVNQLKQIKNWKIVWKYKAFKRTEFILFFQLFKYGVLKYPQKKKRDIIDQLDKTTG